MFLICAYGDDVKSVRIKLSRVLQNTVQSLHLDSEEGDDKEASHFIEDTTYMHSDVTS